MDWPAWDRNIASWLGFSCVIVLNCGFCLSTVVGYSFLLSGDSRLPPFQLELMLA